MPAACGLSFVGTFPVPRKFPSPSNLLLVRLAICCYILSIDPANHPPPWRDGGEGAEMAQQIDLNALTFERSDNGEWIASAGTYHTGYGATQGDAVDALLWSMRNE